METKFQPTNETPLAALSIGQFKELLNLMIKPLPIQLTPTTCLVKVMLSS